MYLLTALMLAGCAAGTGAGSGDYKKYSYEFTGVFDTLVQIIGYTKTAEEFNAYTGQAKVRFGKLHELFDIYHEYPGINNLYTINKNAGKQPVAVSPEIIELILLSKELYSKTGGAVNIALGPVLEIWHDYRDEGSSDPGQAKLPPLIDLQKAAVYTDIDQVIVDREKKTVYLPNSKMSLDIGAVAKGYATELVAQELKAAGFNSFVISGGGNVCLVGKPLDGQRDKWGIGVQNPRGNLLVPDDKPLETIFAVDTSIVTSGDYQRYYEVDGEIYHHLIDPKTLMPANYYRAVTVMHPDSGVADFMSSALFLLPYDESRAVTKSIIGLEALWIFPDGRVEATEGMKNSLKNLGGAKSK